MRFSLEATGIDVGDLLKKVFNFELKWFKNGKLPEYQSIVGGFLTNNPEKVIDSCNKFVGLKLS